MEELFLYQFYENDYFMHVKTGCMTLSKGHMTLSNKAITQWHEITGQWQFFRQGPGQRTPLQHTMTDDVLYNNPSVTAAYNKIAQSSS